MYVFDACAVIALLEGEAGAEVVEELLLQDDRACSIHIINVCEVYYHIHRLAGEARAEQLEETLATYGLILNSSLSPGLWKAAGRLKSEWRRISLADCFAVALAMEVGGTLVTSDHHELDRLAQAGICSIRFIR